MSDEGDGNKDLGELSHIDRKKVGNRTVKDGWGLFEDGNTRANQMEKDIKGSIEGVARPGAVGQVMPQPQQPPQGICWERFLHLRSVRVLLVENDDSTRHVVAALLRNCSYEVVEASNGLQAWKVLEDITNRIDLILTEVVMPCVSGVALLCKIMSHKTRKNVPVIMMSSHDSMGLVFKCLSKGAVDFLVKPIRKNELKNLWQHVWRRCHSSSGSGSESGTQTQKSIESKSAEKSDNNSGSNDDEDNGSPALNFGDGSDHGSGTQSSWTKQAVEEVESPSLVSQLKEVPECPDSTCALVIYPNAKPSGSKLLSMTATNECQEEKEPPGNTELEKASDTGVLKNSDLRLKFPVEVPTELSSGNQYSAPKLESSLYSEQLINRMRVLNGENLSGELNCKDPNTIDVIHPDSAGRRTEVKESGVANNFSNIAEINDKATDESKELVSTDQGLKRRRGSQDTGKAVQDDRNVLRRSESSAFSRYKASSHNKVSNVDAQSPNLLENGVDRKNERRHNIQSHSGSNAPNQCSNEGSVYADMTSSSDNGLTEMTALKNKTAEALTAKHSYPSAFRAVKNNQVSSPQQAMLEDIDDAPAVKIIVPSVSITQDLHVQSAQNVQQRQLSSNHENFLIKKMAEQIPHCGSSTLLVGHLEGNAGNYSVNGSVSGSNYGSNGPNGSSSAVNAGMMKMESDNGARGQHGSGDASGSGSGSASGDGSGSGSRSGSGSGNKMDQSKLAQREAALTKFRQKRKERCFNRKVRYQSRKKLAEQRPRVRGQFVRQAPAESTSQDPDR